MRRIARTCAIALMMTAIAMLPACDGDRDAARPAGESASNAALPAPEDARGSITGMPDSLGPGTLPATPGDLPPDTPVASDGSIGALPASSSLDGRADGDGMVPSHPGTAEDHLLLPPQTKPTPAGNEPTAQDAVAVLRDYYLAIDAGHHARAYALWSDGGRASGQSPQQFADGFADTAAVAIEIETPGRVEPAAGSRYIDIPLAISTTRHDGSVDRYLGIYTLRRAAVDGASAQQRAWRIASADIREVRP